MKSRLQLWRPPSRPCLQQRRTSRLLRYADGTYASRRRHASTETNVVQQPHVEQEYLVSPGASKARFTHAMKFSDPLPKESVSVFRIMNPDGILDNPDWKPDVDPEEVIIWYKNMITISIFDRIMFEAQRQGRISFYLTSEGEEAIGIGAASALGHHDVLFAQYREQGAFLQRGFTLKEFMSQLFANKNDHGKGRNMPVQYGSKALRLHTMSAPLCTQVPQAAGAAYALKVQHQRGDSPPAIVACFFGDGAASEGDFHAGLNMAATRSCPVVYVCRNNGYAISTSSVDQYKGDGIVSRGPGYGMTTLRVDGNDIFAVRQAILEAKRLALEGDCQPVLVEAMSYRVAHHSTSDDSFAYRARDEVEAWRQRDGGLNRLRKYLENNQLWSEESEKEFRVTARRQILQEFAIAEKTQKPPLRAMFDDVYKTNSEETKMQMRKLRSILEKYPGEYDLSEYEGGLASLKE